MSFHTEMANDLDTVFNVSEMAETVSYNGSDIYAIVIRHTETEKQTGLVISDATVIVKQSDVSRPSVNDHIVIDSIDYRIGKIDTQGALTWTLETNKWAHG